MKPSIQAFIDEYLIDHNGAEAARRAGYAAASAKQRAHLLLNRPEVIDAIAEGHAQRRVRSGLHVDEIITDLSHLARSAPSIAQRLRAYTLVMRYYGMLSGKRQNPDDDPRDFLCTRIGRMQTALALAGKPFLDDVEEEVDLDVLADLIRDELPDDADAGGPAAQAPGGAAALAGHPAPTTPPGPISRPASTVEPVPPPPAAGAQAVPDPHRAGPDRGASAEPTTAPIQPASAPPRSAPVRPGPAGPAPAPPPRPAPRWPLPGVEPPRPPRRPDPMHAVVEATHDPALARVWAAISDHPGPHRPGQG